MVVWYLQLNATIQTSLTKQTEKKDELKVKLKAERLGDQLLDYAHKQKLNDNICQ